MACIDLTVSKGQHNGLPRITTHLSGINSRSNVDIDYDFVSGEFPGIPSVLDGFVFPALMPAMRHGKDIVVHGPISKAGLYNMIEIMSAWSCLDTSQYSLVDIRAETVVNTDRAPLNKPIMALSGGVDSTFTLLRHKLRKLGDASLDIRDAVLVCGFDIPTTRLIDFTSLSDKVDILAKSHGVSLHIIRCTSREQRLAMWSYSHMLEIGACLHLFSRTHDMAVVASSSPYSNLIHPWGSTPTLDHLISSGLMRMIHDGGAFSRYQKVELITQDPVALNNLKVCYEELGPGNCGRCEKCVRTKLSFLSIGQEIPPCFNEPLDESLIPSLFITTSLQVGFLQGICAQARSRNINDSWVRKIEEILDADSRPSARKRSRIAVRRRKDGIKRVITDLWIRLSSI